MHALNMAAECTYELAQTNYEPVDVLVYQQSLPQTIFIYFLFNSPLWKLCTN